MEHQYKSYTISNGNIKVELSDLGAVMKRLILQHEGQEIDIVLGFDKEEDYIENSGTYFGAVVGRNANRIEDSVFSIDGKQYEGEANDGENNLHSGSNGFNQRVWHVDEQTDSSITFSLESSHLDQGFPGELTMTVTYEITEDDALKVSYKGQSDRLTVFNPTNHSYFNLNGHASGEVFHHQLWLNSDYYSELNDESIPTGKLLPVKDTVMDFTQLKVISEDRSNEYDDNFILKSHDIHEKAATLIGNQTSIQMDVYTNSPCLQLYTGNGIDGVKGKGNLVYYKNAGVCLEPQHEPNSINSEHPPLIDGEKEYMTIYRFSKL